MNHAEVKLTCGRADRGVFPVSLMYGDKVLFTGRVNPHKVETIQDFVENACREYPAISGDELRSELRQLAAPPPAKPAVAIDACLDVPYLMTRKGIFWRKPTR